MLENIQIVGRITITIIIKFYGISVPFRSVRIKIDLYLDDDKSENLNILPFDMFWMLIDMNGD